MNCLSPDQIKQLYAMRGAEFISLLEHLESCENCRKITQEVSTARLEAKFRQHQETKGSNSYSRAEFRSFLIDYWLGDDDE